MGLLKGPLKKRQSIEKFVYSEDPAVKVPPERKGCGWFPLSEALGAGAAASVVTLQSLDPDPLNALDDIAGMNEKFLAAARAGAIDCNEVSRDPGKHLSEGVSLWLDCLVFDDPRAARLLGFRVLTMSKSHDPEVYYAAARRTFGVVNAGDGGPDEATKSPGEPA